jgi:uncharacterized protein
MNILRYIAAAALGAGLASPALADPVTDCPLRGAPFSASTPLIDILLSPAARAVVEKELGANFDEAPPQFAGIEPPTFAAILTLREFAGMVGKPPETVERASKALEALPVTETDKAARCARYDNDKPAFDLPKGKPAILLFGKITGFKDVPSVEAAQAAIEDIAKRRGWTLAASDKGGAISADVLSQFDAIISKAAAGLSRCTARAATRSISGTGMPTR